MVVMNYMNWQNWIQKDNIVVRKMTLKNSNINILKSSHKKNNNNETNLLNKSPHN